MNLLIKNSNIIDAYESFNGDILIIDGIISEIGKEINRDGIEVIDAKGLTLMPSFIDTHAHFRDPGLTHKEDMESGSKAAAKGGYTGVCLMGNTNPICSSKEVVEYVRNRAKEVGLIDVHQCVSITENFGGKSNAAVALIFFSLTPRHTSSMTVVIFRIRDSRFLIN